jgi:hypothetical protein
LICFHQLFGSPLLAINIATILLSRTTYKGKEKMSRRPLSQRCGTEIPVPFFQKEISNTD